MLHREKLHVRRYYKDKRESDDEKDLIFWLCGPLRVAVVVVIVVKTTVASGVSVAVRELGRVLLIVSLHGALRARVRLRRALATRNRLGDRGAVLVWLIRLVRRLVLIIERVRLANWRLRLCGARALLIVMGRPPAVRVLGRIVVRRREEGLLRRVVAGRRRVVAVVGGHVLLRRGARAIRLVVAHGCLVNGLLGLSRRLLSLCGRLLLRSLALVASVGCRLARGEALVASVRLGLRGRLCRLLRLLHRWLHRWLHRLLRLLGHRLRLRLRLLLHRLLLLLHRLLHRLLLRLLLGLGLLQKVSRLVRLLGVRGEDGLRLGVGLDLFSGITPVGGLLRSAHAFGAGGGLGTRSRSWRRGDGRSRRGLSCSGLLRGGVFLRRTRLGLLITRDGERLEGLNRQGWLSPG